jgi:hypothetical protein
MIQIYIFHLNSPNMGDNFNRIIFPLIIDSKKFQINFICITDVNSLDKIKQDDLVIFGIGSIIENAYKIYNKILEVLPNFNNIYIYSSGLKNESPLEITRNNIIKKFNFMSVRGYLTNKCFGIDKPVGDLGLLLPMIIKPDNKLKTFEYEIGIIPHCVENDGLTIIEEVKEWYSHPKCKLDNSQILFINIVDNIENFVKKIQKCRYLISGSLHGIIFGDSLNIPSYHILLTNRIDPINNFKYKDYFSSIKRDYFNINKPINNENINNIIDSLKLYPKHINILDSLSNDLLGSEYLDQFKNKIINNKISYLEPYYNTINSENIDSNISIIIASCMKIKGKKGCLFEVIKNLKCYLPNSEIIIGFDQEGLNIQDFTELPDTSNITFFNHNRGLGHSWNYGTQIAKNNIILQTEDDWIIHNLNIDKPDKLKDHLFQSLKILLKDINSCVRLDGGMFDEIGGNSEYPLGYKEEILNGFKYYKYNLPNLKELEDNYWLKFAFCNHPHLKFKETTIKFPYIEKINPGELENNYSFNWVKQGLNIYYIKINENKNNLDKNIFKHIGYEFSYRV